MPVHDTSIQQTNPGTSASFHDSLTEITSDSTWMRNMDTVSESTKTVSGFLYGSQQSWGEKPITIIHYQPFVPDWILGLFFLTLVLGAWIRYWNSNMLGLIFKAIYTRRDFQFLLRESSNIPNSVPFSINLIYTSGLGLMTFVLTQGFFRSQFYPEINNLIFFSICFLIVTVLFYLKLSFVNILGSIFKIHQISLEYHYNSLIFRLISSVGLVIFLILNFFFPAVHFLFAALIWISLIYLIRSVKGVLIIGSKQSTSIYYIILYFCTLEILPVVVLAKSVNVFIK